MSKRELKAISKKVLPCGRPAPIPAEPDEEKLGRWKAQLKKHLEANGLKYSEQRWVIAQTILLSRGHYSAQELVRDVLRKHPEIGAATVYRNINLLCEAQILRETMVDAKGNVVYESFDPEHHDHIVCLDCNEILEFADGEIEALQDTILKKLKFSQVRHRHVLYARCQYK